MKWFGSDLPSLARSLARPLLRLPIVCAASRRHARMVYLPLHRREGSPEQRHRHRRSSREESSAAKLFSVAVFLLNLHNLLLFSPPLLFPFSLATLLIMRARALSLARSRLNKKANPRLVVLDELSGSLLVLAYVWFISLSTSPPLHLSTFLPLHLSSSPADKSAWFSSFVVVVVAVFNSSPPPPRR